MTANNQANENSKKKEVLGLVNQVLDFAGITNHTIGRQLGCMRIDGIHRIGISVGFLKGEGDMTLAVQKMEAVAAYINAKVGKETMWVNHEHSIFDVFVHADRVAAAAAALKGLDRNTVFASMPMRTPRMDKGFGSQAFDQFIPA